MFDTIDSELVLIERGRRIWLHFFAVASMMIFVLTGVLPSHASATKGFGLLVRSSDPEVFAKRVESQLEESDKVRTGGEEGIVINLSDGSDLRVGSTSEFSFLEGPFNLDYLNLTRGRFVITASMKKTNTLMVKNCKLTVNAGSAAAVNVSSEDVAVTLFRGRGLELAANNQSEVITRPGFRTRSTCDEGGSVSTARRASSDQVSPFAKLLAGRYHPPSQGTIKNQNRQGQADAIQTSAAPTEAPDGYKINPQEFNNATAGPTAAGPVVVLSAPSPSAEAKSVGTESVMIDGIEASGQYGAGINSMQVRTVIVTSGGSGGQDKIIITFINPETNMEETLELSQAEMSITNYQGREYASSLQDQTLYILDLNRDEEDDINTGIIAKNAFPFENSLIENVIATDVFYAGYSLYKPSTDSASQWREFENGQFSIDKTGEFLVASFEDQVFEGYVNQGEVREFQLLSVSDREAAITSYPLLIDPPSLVDINDLETEVPEYTYLDWGVISGILTNADSAETSFLPLGWVGGKKFQINDIKSFSGVAIYNGHTYGTAREGSGYRNALGTFSNTWDFGNSKVDVDMMFDGTTYRADELDPIINDGFKISFPNSGRIVTLNGDFFGEVKNDSPTAIGGAFDINSSDNSYKALGVFVGEKN